MNLFVIGRKLLNYLKRDDVRFYIYLIALLILIKLSYLYVTFIVFYIPIIYFFIKNRGMLLSKARQLIGAGVLTGFAFFIFRVIAEKNINHQLEIEKEYINYSATVYGFFLTIMTIPALIGFLYCLVYLLKLAYFSVINFFYPCPERNKHFNMAYSSLFRVLGVMFFVAFLSELSNKNKLINYLVILDSYSVSECKQNVPPDKEKYYIRANREFCYEIVWGNFNSPPAFRKFKNLKI